jgi:hypothetical protein
MEVSDCIAEARQIAESMARLARILTRIKPIIYATGATIRFHGEDVSFYCATEEDAMKLAQALPGKLELAYQGVSTTLYGTIHIQGVDFIFSVPTFRKIRFEDCTVKKSRAQYTTGWQKARLFFQDLELCELRYQNNSIRGDLKEKLWNHAIAKQKENHRLAKFVFVL